MFDGSRAQDVEMPLKRSISEQRGRTFNSRGIERRSGVLATFCILLLQQILLLNEVSN